MKKTTLINAPLSYEIASLGHTDALTLCDAGLPIGGTAKRIDLALCAGTPSLMATLKVVGEEMFVERAVMAAQIKSQSPDMHEEILAFLQRLQESQGNEIQIDYVLHDSFKQLANQSRAIVRTGECTPFANVILYSGVPF